MSKVTVYNVEFNSIREFHRVFNLHFPPNLNRRERNQLLEILSNKARRHLHMVDRNEYSDEDVSHALYERYQLYKYGGKGCEYINRIKKLILESDIKDNIQEDLIHFAKGDFLLELGKALDINIRRKATMDKDSNQE